MPQEDPPQSAHVVPWQQAQLPPIVRATALLAATAESRQRTCSNRPVLHDRPPMVLAVSLARTARKDQAMLSGIVEVDEAWFGKRKFGGQTIVMGAIERDTGRLKLARIPDTEQNSLEGFLEEHVARGSLVVTDAKTGYNGLEFLGFGHESWNHSAGHFAGTNHIEANWSAMKRHLRKLYGCIPTKKLQFVLNEWEARHNRPTLFDSPQIFLRETLRLGFCD